MMMMKAKQFETVLKLFDTFFSVLFVFEPPGVSPGSKG